MSCLINNATHFALPRSEHTMVKEADYFRSKGGLTKEWGRAWVPVVANGMEHARLLGWFVDSGVEHPMSCSFNRPNTRTVGEILGETA